jgi:UDPglucose 6-dehydrogenase/GDP-mannose 6-dehydrogenase
MHVSIVGTGYVGLVSGVCLAEKGHVVTCVDVDEDKVARINEGVTPIYEDGLKPLLERNIGKRLRATTDLREAVMQTELTLIAVGTPFDGSAIDLRYIEQVAAEIGAVLRGKPGYHVVVVKSTVVPGTTDEVVIPVLERASGKRAGEDFGVGMNPEFLREGKAVEDFMHPDRIVLGGMDERSHEALAELYAVFPKVEQLKASNKTAEMIKYAANALFATMISFSNEIGNLCAALGDIDVTEVMHGVHLDKRLSPILEDGSRLTPEFTTYLEAGCGFGGSCFPKDVKALIAHGQRAGQAMPLLDAVMKVNEEQPKQLLRLLDKHFASLEKRQLAVLGLAFKPGTDDVRESPAIPVIRELVARGASVNAYDPVARDAARAVLGNSQIRYRDSLQEAVRGADAVLVLTSWPEFEALPALLDKMGVHPLVVDGRRMLEPETVAHYAGIGLS